MIEPRGEHIVLRTMERAHCHHLDPYRVYAATAAYNAGAQRVLEKCGFVQEGREREAVYVGGRRWDRLCYGLLRPELEAGQPPLTIGRPADP